MLKRDSLKIFPGPLENDWNRWCIRQPLSGAVEESEMKSFRPQGSRAAASTRQPWLCVLNVHQDQQRQEDQTVIVENFRDLTFKSIIHSRRQGAQNNSQRIPLNLSAALSGKLVHITEIKWVFCPLPPNFPCLIWWNHQPCGHWCHKFWNHPQLCFFLNLLHPIRSY